MVRAGRQALSEAATVDDELWRTTASDAVAALRRGDLRPAELVAAAIARIEAVDGVVNALPERCFDRALDRARRLERAGRSPDPRDLQGLPVAVKDCNDVGGVRTTHGTPIFADLVPPRCCRSTRALPPESERGRPPAAQPGSGPPCSSHRAQSGGSTRSRVAS